MSMPTPFGRALVYIADTHAGFTILNLVFGLPVAGDRAGRFVLDMAGRVVEQGMNIDTIVAGSYWPSSGLQPHRALPIGAIAFEVRVEGMVHDSDIIETVHEDQQYAKKRWCILDIRTTHPDRTIPATIVMPYAGQINRLNTVLEMTDMLPLWFWQSNGTLGIPVVGNGFVSCPDRPTRVEATSLKIVFHWPNYGPTEKQIQLRTESSQGQSNVNVSLRRLSTLISGAVINAMNTYERHAVGRTEWDNPRWRIGTGPGRIGAQDVILLGIVWVSPGRVMTLLQVRPGFVFVD